MRHGLSTQAVPLRPSPIPTLRRKNTMRAKTFVAFLLGVLLSSLCPLPAHAADWQWSVPVESVTSSETNDHPRALLWIPPNCKRVRAVVVGQHNMQEEPIFEQPKFRAAMSELGFAEVWITPPLDLFFRFDKGADEHFKAMMAALAQESGYSELQWAPIVPIGHSAAASYPWNYAALHPERTLAVLSVSGQWPYYKDVNTPDWGNRTVDGIPGLVTMGEYEDAAGRAAEGLQQRTAHTQLPLSMLQEPAAGHFDATDTKVEYLALYLKKAAQYRLPDNAPLDGPVTLKPIDPTKQGWLADRWRKDQPPQAPAAPVGQYSADAKDAFWFFDEEMTKAIEQLEANYRGKKADLLGYLQDGQIVPQNPKTHQQVTLRFLPVGDDGMTFKLSGTFLDTVPEGRPEGWTGLKADSPLGHATGGGPVVINRIAGPVEKVSDDTFRLRFDRMGTNNKKRGHEIWLVATHPGDEEYRRAAQQSVLNFPRQNTAGADQTINFPEILNQKFGAATLKLNATSSAGVPVHFYVQEGPAELDGDTLKFTAIPPRTKFPVKVTVTAWQWGRSIEPKMKTAEPVARSFYLTKDGTSASTDNRASEQTARAALWEQAKTAAQALISPATAITTSTTPVVQPSTPGVAGNAIGFNIYKNLEMRPQDLAGAEVRQGIWNNLREVKANTPLTLNAVMDKDGKVVPNLSFTITGGSTAFNTNTFDDKTDANATANDTRLYNGVFDQNQGQATTITFTGIPFARYDVYFYRSDDGAAASSASATKYSTCAAAKAIPTTPAPITCVRRTRH
jgi:hypothetical protein